MSPITTFMPAFFSALAMPRPMPEAPPVTNAVLPDRFCMFLLFELGDAAAIRLEAGPQDDEGDGADHRMAGGERVADLSLVAENIIGEEGEHARAEPGPDHVESEQDQSGHLAAHPVWSCGLYCGILRAEKQRGAKQADRARSGGQPAVRHQGRGEQ